MITYNVTISASGTGKQRRRALALLTHPQGIQGNVITYNAALSLAMRASRGNVSLAARASSGRAPWNC